MVSQHVLPKPANRPSRRQDLIASAIDLFSLQPSDLVTVADIVERAGMTPAAFYYHFSSREQLMEEVVADFCKIWVTTIERLLSEASTVDDLAGVGTSLLDEIEPREQVAKIFFLSGAATLAVVEQLRRDARTRLIKSAARAVKRVDRRRSGPDALVNGITMVTLYESAVRSRLVLDETYRTLGPRRFREELVDLGRIASGFAEV